MAEEVILVDTSILIDFYRKTNKEKTVWISLLRKGYRFSVSAVTKYEIYSGATKEQVEYWNMILENISVLPFDNEVVDRAVEINAELKKKRKQIDLADLFIAATAVSNRQAIATLNKNHFDRIDGLRLIEL